LSETALFADSLFKRRGNFCAATRTALCAVKAWRNNTQSIEQMLFMPMPFLREVQLELKLKAMLMTTIYLAAYTGVMQSSTLGQGKASRRCPEIGLYRSAKCCDLSIGKPFPPNKTLSEIDFAPCIDKE